MANDRTFAKGIYYNLPRDGAPGWVRGSLSIKAVDAIAFIKNNTNSEGYVNVDLTESQAGKGCAFLNTYDKGNSQRQQQSSSGSGMFSSGGDNDRF